MHKQITAAIAALTLLAMPAVSVTPALAAGTSSKADTTSTSKLPATAALGTAGAGVGALSTTVLLPGSTPSATVAFATVKLPTDTMEGVDLSRYQTAVHGVTVDYQGLADSGEQFMLARTGSSEGCPRRTVIVQRYDTSYETHVAGAKAAGLKIGHYWFNGLGTPEADAAFFVSKLQNYSTGDPLVLDLEAHYSWHWSEKKSKYVCKHKLTWGQDDALKWVAAVRAALPGANVYVYMGHHTLHTHKWNKLAAVTRLWYAAYGKKKGKPGKLPDLKYWKDWSIWQYTNTGKLSAVTGKSSAVDRNFARADAWTALPTTSAAASASATASASASTSASATASASVSASASESSSN